MSRAVELACSTLISSYTRYEKANVQNENVAHRAGKSFSKDVITHNTNGARNARQINIVEICRTAAARVRQTTT